MPASSVAVEVPATSANLGPGFDSLGVALDWTLRLRFTPHDEPLPPPGDPVALLAGQAAHALWSRAALPAPPGLEVAADPGGPPVGRGLGLSAAARVAGLLAADALSGAGLGREALFGLAAQLERHADNAAPAMFGGLQIVAEREGGDPLRLGLEPPAGLRFVLLVPGFSMPTEETRERLPQRVSRNHAVHNIGRAALLVAALAERRWDLLATATEDVIHQPARATIFEAMYPIFRAARDAGAHGAYLSGGGPSIAALATSGFEDVAGAMREAAAARGVEAFARVCAPRAEGAALLPADEA